jgi:putative ABC transport system permease protein
LGLQRYFAQPSRIILRNIERRPWKALLTVIGIAFGCGILVLGRFQESAIDFMLTVQFGFAQRADLTVTFVEPTSRRVIYDLAALPGVYQVEPYRAAAVTLRTGRYSHRTAIQGIAPNGDLRRVLDTQLRVMELPSGGVVLTDYLARQLGVIPGDPLSLEFHEGRRETIQVPVVGLVKEYLGVSAYMPLEDLNRLLREGAAVSGAYLAIDSRQRNAIIRYLTNSPRIAGVSDRLSAIESFYESMAEVVLVFAFFTTVLAASIAFGVVYNSARIALAERSRELASLRVLGFTRGEISYILLGELGLLTITAIPLGFLIGRGLAAYVVQGIESDLYRVPVVLEPPVYTFAALVIFASAVVSSFVIQRRLNRLNLVAVLKTKE